MMIKRIAIVIIIIFSIAFVTGKLFDNLYKKRWSTLFFEKTGESINGKINYDVLLVGNSRVHFGLNPYYIDSATKLNCYNLGFGGAGAEEMMIALSVYLQHHKAPKLTIISLDAGTLIRFMNIRTRFDYLFYLENDTVNKYMQQAGFLTPLMKIFPFTKYSFFDEYNRTSLFIKGKPFPVFDHNIYKGFINIHQQMNTKAANLYNVPENTSQVWDTAVVYLNNMVNALNIAGSKIIFISPPERISSPNRKEIITNIADSIFTNIAAKNNSKYLHFENNRKFTDGYFVDDIHLNEPGTKIYSFQLADSINKIYPNLKQAQ